MFAAGHLQCISVRVKHLLLHAQNASEQMQDLRLKTVPGEGAEWLQEEKEPILLPDSEPSESSRFCGTNGIGQCTAWPARRLLLRGQGLIILLPASRSPLSSSESAPAAPRKQSSKASWGPHEEPIGQTPHHHKASFKGTWDYRNLRHGTPKVWRLLPKSGLYNNVQSSTVW